MIYLDNAATTPLSPRISTVLARAYSEYFGNPSSLHGEGQKAHQLLEDARKRIGKILGFDSSGIVFTGGATEAANILLQGYCSFLRRINSPKNEIVITSFEHPAIDNTTAYLEKNNFIVKKCAVQKNGAVSVEDLKEKITDATAIVCIIHTNNETGAVQQVNTLAKICKEKNPDLLFMTDVTQAVGKVDLGITPDLIDAFFLSGHKIGTPKGMGLFYLNPKFRIQPLIHGGGQERGYRAGTTSPVNAYLLAEAIEDRVSGLKSNFETVSNLRSLLLRRASDKGIDCRVISDLENSSPYVLSLAVIGYKGEFLLRELSARGICVSQGSACSSGSHIKSRVLEAIGVEDEIMGSVIRVSFSPENTEEEVEVFVDALGSITE